MRSRDPASSNQRTRQQWRECEPCTAGWDWAEPVAGPLLWCRSRPPAPGQPSQSPVTPAEKPELGQASALCYRLGCKISLFWNFIVQIVGNVNRVTWEKTKTEEKWLIDVRILEVFSDKLWAKFLCPVLWPQHKRRSCWGRKLRVKLGSLRLRIFWSGILRVTSGWFDLVLESQSILITLSSLHHVIPNYCTFENCTTTSSDCS